MNLLEILRARQEADQRELDTLTSVEVADFTPETEARATALAESIRSRQTEIDREVESVARRDAATTAAVERSEPEVPETRVSPAVVKSEERTYTAHKDAQGTASYFRDSYLSEFGQDVAARDRIQRHMREMAVEGEGVQSRATTTTSFAGLVVPQYLVDQAAAIARAGRPFANTCTRLPLPDQGMVFYITKGTTGASTAIQATQNLNVSSTDQVWADVQVNVQTIAGQQDISRQSLERGTPGLDSLVYMDLAGAYAVALDTQIITGTGTGTKGIYNAGGTQESAFGAAATPVTFYTKVAGGVKDVLTNRYLPPTHILMHPRRWAWLLSQSDTTNRPLVVPNAQGPFNNTADENGPGYGQVVGTLQGLPVVTDASVQTSQGSGPEDVVYVYRNSDCLLWEDGDGSPRQLRFEQTLGNQLTVKLVVYGYMAFTAERYPLGVSIIGGNAALGNGLVAPTF